jgi:hypothetical protein
MTTQPGKPTPLSVEHAEFLQGGLAIDLATRDRRNIPSLARAIGCRIAPDRSRLSVLVANRMIDRFIAALTDTQMIAAVFCLASTHRAVQVKGTDAVIEKALPTDVALVEQTITEFAADIVKLGFEEAHARADMTYRPEELIVITFTPDAVYEQTPGPDAGKRL